jgi:hypothetical protein
MLCSLVYDLRKKNSIKSAERERRTKVTAHTKVFQVSKSGNERTGETSFSNCFTRSDLQDFLIVPFVRCKAYPSPLSSLPLKIRETER